MIANFIQSSSSKSPQTRLNSFCWRAVRSLLIIYLGVILGMSMIQEWLIFPGMASQGQSSA